MRTLATAFLAVWLCTAPTSFLQAKVAAEVMTFTHPPAAFAGDQRHTYYWELLSAALACNQDRFGDYNVAPYARTLPFKRSVAEVASGHGRVNVIARVFSHELNKTLRVVNLPLDRGLLGLRLFLVMPAAQQRLMSVRTLDELRQFSMGQSPTWTDVDILRAGGFRVVLVDSQQALFQMLGAGRFDVFPRGAIEAMDELRHAGPMVPGIQLEKSLLLHYPLSRYYMVPRTPVGERMAQRIEDGLMCLKRTGELDRRYRAYKALMLAEVPLSGRRVFRLPNPILPANPPFSDRAWWDDFATELRPIRSKSNSTRPSSP